MRRAGDVGESVRFVAPHVAEARLGREPSVIYKLYQLRATTLIWPMVDTH
jgi:hypothetical protein